MQYLQHMPLSQNKYNTSSELFSQLSFFVALPANSFHDPFDAVAWCCATQLALLSKFRLNFEYRRLIYFINAQLLCHHQRRSCCVCVDTPTSSIILAGQAR
jgi:hypothetical protein